ncbi:MAG: helix-turn-helix transcriptional regulator [Ruminococcaceae bacterium]|nr:helix-turn-helix transcriptional regulator [Oscillospiraceae bacterium]
MQIGKSIRKLRMERGITQEVLAETMHVSPQSVSKWETGSGCPDRHTSAHFQPVF